MKQELIDLLQNENIHNRTIGAFTAYHDGYGTVDIFNQLKPIVSDSICFTSWKKLEKHTYQIGRFSIVIEDHYCDKKTITISEDKTRLNYIKTNKPKLIEKLKHIFMEYVLDDLPPD